MKSEILSVFPKSPVPDVSLPLIWPQTLISLGAVPSAEGSLISHKAKKAAATASSVKVFCEKARKSNWLHNVAGDSGIVCCPDFFDAMPKPGSNRDKIWEVVDEARHLCWLLPIRRLDHVTACLPTYWKERPYPNVCIALILDGDAEANLRQLQALKETPARLRALWVKSGHDMEMSDDWLEGVDWIIADTTDEGPSRLPAETMEWVAKIRVACRAKGIAFLHNHLGDDDSAASVDGTDDPPAHPFAKKIKPASSTKLARTATPDSVAISEMPSPANISAADDTTVVESSAIIGRDSHLGVADASEPEEPATSPIVPDDFDLGVFVAEIVTASPFDETDSVANRLRFEGLDAIVRKGLKAFVEAGIALLEIRGDELWREGGYASFDDYCDRVLGFKANYANRIAKHAVIAVELSKAKVPMDEAGNPIIPKNEFQCRALAKLEGLPQWLKAWKLAVKRASGMPTAAIVVEVAGELKAKNSLPKVPTRSRRERLKELIGQLRQAAESESFDLVLKIATQLEDLA